MIPAAAVDDRASELRRWDRRLLLGLILALLVLASPWIVWQFTARRTVALAVMDKTVAHENWQEHEALFWWMNHDHLRPDSAPSWNARRNYVGYDPVAKRGTLLTDSALAYTSLLYVADAYGVYSGDYADTSRARVAADTTAVEHSEKLFGGVTLSEAQVMERFAARGGGIVAEFNTLESPTSGTSAAPIVERLVGAVYLGWLGRWYKDLSSTDEVPRWMRDRFVKKYDAAWDFHGPGIVLFNEASDAIAVVEEAHFTDRFPVTIEIVKPNDPLVQGAASGRPYWYWFSGIAPASNGVVLANYQLHVDSVGRQRLSAQGFPTSFPAIVRTTGSTLGAYLAGDFADVGGAMPRYQRTALLDWWRRLESRFTSRPGEAMDVYWNVVVRVWGNALREVGG
ncbi:MAG: hypothetical protein JWO05_1436 [Gemmatimonadetes bacterium]|nr:hypothetical protein [Gemmatimonadota bacterium]